MTAIGVIQVVLSTSVFNKLEVGLQKQLWVLMTLGYTLWVDICRVEGCSLHGKKSNGKPQRWERGGP